MVDKSRRLEGREIQNVTPAKAISGSVVILLVIIRVMTINEQDDVDLEPSHADICKVLERVIGGRKLDNLGNIIPGEPGFKEAQWITPEDMNVEHLLDAFTTIDASSKGAIESSRRRMNRFGPAKVTVSLAKCIDPSERRREPLTILR